MSAENQSATPATTTIRPEVELQAKNYHPSIHTSSNAEFTSLIHLEAPALPESKEEEDRKAIQVSAVLDVSGSMQGEKLKLAKEALAFLVSELSLKDKFGLITFGSDVVEDHRPTAMNATGKHNLETTVKGLHTRGCTNLSGGLLTGIAQASGDGSSAAPIPVCDVSFGSSRRMMKNRIPSPMQQQQQQMPPTQTPTPAPGIFSRMKNMLSSSSAKVNSAPSTPPPTTAPATGITASSANQESTSITFAPPAPQTAKSHDRQRRVVLLFTDGQANEGIQDVEGLTAATKKTLSEQTHDVTVFTFGFGSDHNATLLRQLAECSEGSYYFIESARDMKEIFADCLGGLLSVVAEKIQIQVKPLSTTDAPCRVAKVATHYPLEQAPDGTFTVRVKDLYAEEKRDVLVYIAVDTSKCQVGQALPLVQVKLTYQDPHAEGATVTKETGITTTVADGMYDGPVDEHVDEQIARHKAVEAMTAAQKAADDGDFNTAHQVLKQQLAKAETMSCAKTPFGLGITEELKNALNDAQNESHYREVGQKKMAMKQCAHAQQRSNAVDMTEMNANMYATSAKSRMKTKSSAFSFKN